MLYPPSVDFLEAFFGCLYAGAIAVPAYLPEPSRMARAMERLRPILSDCVPSVVATTAATASLLATMQRDLPMPQALATDAVEPPLAASWRPPAIDARTVAFLQYTSGSTSEPKGVVVHHDNLIANCGDMVHHLDLHPDSVMVSWLPVFHDMGLIMGTLAPLLAGATTHLMAPLAFVRRPAMWLQAIALHRGTHSTAPNFAYELCLERIPAAERAALDLRTWRVAVNAAEPVRAETLERFTAAFAAAGFDGDAFTPATGWPRARSCSPADRVLGRQSAGTCKPQRSSRDAPSAQSLGAAACPWSAAASPCRAPRYAWSIRRRTCHAHRASSARSG